MKIIHESFPDNEYIKAPQKKELIVLHHTVSSSGKYVDDAWKQDKGKSRVATPFVIEKDGTIIQLFDAACWAYHIGKGSTDLHNKRSIGIEIANEGLLTRKVIGSQVKYFWLDGNHEFKGEVYTHPTQWRGSCFFAKYTEEQIIAVAELVEKLCKEFSIEKNMLTGFDYNANYLMHKGICSHHNLRPDKSDLSPAFPLARLNELLKAV